MATKRKKLSTKKTASRAVRSTRAVKKAAPAVKVQEISPCLWFDTEAEEAAKFYVSVFKTGRIKQIARYPAVGQEIHGKEPGGVMTVDFVINGLRFLALNGGPHFKFNEAISLQVFCETQQEIDYYWEKLGQGGDPKARQCGWLKDKYGLSWQIAPANMGGMMKDHTSPKTVRAFAAMMEMKKLDIAALKKAYAGK